MWPGAALVLAVPVTLLLVNLLAYFPGRVAARTRPAVVLFVGEDGSDARLLQELLNASPAARFELETVNEPQAAIERMSRGDIDATLLDLSLPRALQAVADLAAAGPPAPVLVLSPVEDERLGVQAVRAGAQDFLVKGRLDSQVLVHAVRYAIERHRLGSTLRDLSLLDDLTGLYNRRGFVTLASQDVRLARRERQNLLLAFGDLDGLKRINDTLEHAQGDEALRDVAGILIRTFRESDLIARIGGDEFAVLVRNAEANSVEVLRHRLNDQLQQFNRRARLRVLRHELQIVHQQTDVHVGQVDVQFVRQAALDFRKFEALGYPISHSALLRFIQIHIRFSPIRMDWRCGFN